MDTAVIAALISGAIAILGVFASLITARWQVGLQKKELDLKARELDTTTKQLHSELEALRQTQFTEILKRRLDVYPTVWACVVKYTLHWRTEIKSRDIEWVKDFLEQLTICNAEAGVFFSQAAYTRFNELRNVLINIETQLAAGKHIDEWDLKEPDRIFIGRNGEGGLATFLKDDLGSYRDAAIQARTYLPNSQKYDSDRDDEIDAEQGTTYVVPIEYFNEQRINRRLTSARLIILHSDDTTMVGRIFELQKKYTTMGRKADNDITFAKDIPVSRQHAAIEFRDGKFYICELFSDGQANPPQYGTYVNNERIDKSAQLSNGDKIKLGKRLVLRFEVIS